MFSLARLLSPVPGRVWLDAPGRHGYKGAPPPPPPQTASMLLRCGVRTAWDQGGTPPRPFSSAQPGQKRMLRAPYLL